MPAKSDRINGSSDLVCSHDPKILFSRKLRSQLGITVRIRKRPNARERHQNKHLDFDPLYFASRGSQVRTLSRPPTSPFKHLLIRPLFDFLKAVRALYLAVRCHG
jgi:hypothetical protein